MSAWLIAIIAVASLSGVGMAVVLTNKNLSQASRMQWLLTLALFEGVIIAGLIAMWVLFGME